MGTGRDYFSAFLALLVFVSGLASLIVTPPFQAADEMTHLTRAYALADGQLRGERQGRSIGFEAPWVLVRDVRSYNHLIFHPVVRTSLQEWERLYDESGAWKPKAMARRRFVRCHFACYPPVPHAPQAIAASAGRIFQARTFTVLYAGRLANLLFCCAVLYVAFAMLKDRPKLQLATFLVAGIPMCVFLYSSLSGDALTIALSILIFAWATHLQVDSSTRSFAGLLAVCGLLSLCKSVYVLVPFTAVPAILAAPMPLGVRLRRIGMLCALAILPAIAWVWYVRDLSNYANPFGNDAQTDAATQLAFLIQNPLTVLREWITYTQGHVSGIARTVIGNIGWGETGLPDRLAIDYAAAILLVGVIGYGDSPRSRGKLQIATDLAIVAGSILLIYCAAYLSFGTKQLSGITGRYFLPIAPLAVACIPSAIRLSPGTYLRWRVVIVLLWIAMAFQANTAVARRYWAEMAETPKTPATLPR